MEVDELMRRAWEAVEKSGVPEDLRETAFKEAVAALRNQDQGSDAEDSERGGRTRRKKTTDKRAGSKRRSARRAGEAGSTESLIPDEATFFSRLADESGVDEQLLRDVLQVTKEGVVHVIPATRKLGASKVEQAKTVIALVAGARAYGLGERPVNAGAVREEAKRKHCFDSGNYASNALTPLEGFNAGSNRNQIVLGTRWVGEFAAAIDKARGVEAAEGDES